MAVWMIPNLRKVISRLLPRSGAGGSHLERLRSTIFGLLGAVTAVGLGIVALASSQGWTNFIDLPVPGAPSQHVGDARVVAQAPPPPPAEVAGPEVASGEREQAPIPDREQPSGTPPPTNGQSTGGVPAPPSHDPKAPSKHGAAKAPATEAPAGGAEPGSAPGGPGKAPVADPTSPPDDAQGQPVTTPPPGKGKAKGHGKEKPPKPAKAPPPPEEAPPPPPESPGDGEDGDEGDEDDDDGESHGNGNAHGHDDEDDD